MSEQLWNVGIILILAGFSVTFIAAILLFFTAFKEGKVKGGGAIIIGPFPIVFGTDKESMRILLLLSIILIALLLVFVAFSNFVHG